MASSVLPEESPEAGRPGAGGEGEEAGPAPPEVLHGRHPAIHWSVFLGSVAALWILGTHMFGPGPRMVPDEALVQWDLLLSVAFAVEFFTRKGLRWNWRRYLLTHFFDWVAVVPVLWLVATGLPILGGPLPYAGAWLWLVLAARVVRVIDRVLGDGFVQRNTLALVEGFEEELTDRVLARILARVEENLAEGRFGQAAGEALRRNRDDVLARIRASHPTPREGPGAMLAQAVGLEEMLAKTEERTYDAVVEVLVSEEVERALRDVVTSSFANLREETRVKRYRQRIGVRPLGFRSPRG